MNEESDEQFLKRMAKQYDPVLLKQDPQLDRLFALALRGAAADAVVLKLRKSLGQIIILGERNSPLACADLARSVLNDKGASLPLPPPPSGEPTMSDLVKRLREHCMFTDWQVAIREAHEAAARIEQLEAALRYALENSGSTQYWGDDDDCGTHSCCGEVSYKPHAGYCWTVKARAALERNAHER